MPEITRQSYLDYLSELEHRIKGGDPDTFQPYDPESGYLVTNLTRMPVDRLDFGSGPPALLYPLTTGRHGAVLLQSGDRYIVRTAY